MIRTGRRRLFISDLYNGHVKRCRCSLTVMSNGYRTLSQHLNDLKKENFSLKLRIYFLEERIQQKYEESSEDVYRTVSRAPLIRAPGNEWKPVCPVMNGMMNGTVSGVRTLKGAEGRFTDNRMIKNHWICFVGCTEWLIKSSVVPLSIIMVVVIMTVYSYVILESCFTEPLPLFVDPAVALIWLRWCDLPCVCFTKCLFLDMAALWKSTH